MFPIKDCERSQKKPHEAILHFVLFHAGQRTDIYLFYLEGLQRAKWLLGFKLLLLK